MSYNYNFYNNFHNNNTFQNFPPPHFVQLPPPPPPMSPSPNFRMPPPSLTPHSDQEVIKTLESKLTVVPRPIKSNTTSISKFREHLQSVTSTLNNLKEKEQLLSENIDTLSEEEWRRTMDLIQDNRNQMNEYLSQINDKQLNMLRKLIAQRSAKRLRLKRLHTVRKREKMERMKEMEEKSQEFSKTLQKINYEITRAKQEEEAKIEADIILKEVLRKKHDAKKCLTKLDALVKLRKARQNTAKGRGEETSEGEAIAFENNIAKLKSLWTQKLSSYEKEEAELRAKLKQDQDDVETPASRGEREIEKNLALWRQHLFGDSGLPPQVDFGGDVGRFIAVRSQWDQYISEEGTSLPIGWVLPSTSSTW